MSAYIALALSVGALAILDTWLFGVPLATIAPGMVWISFIAWGCHFHSGGGMRGMTTTMVGMVFGAVVGMAAVMLAGGALVGLGTLSAPVAVGLGAFAICIASAVPMLKTIPASVYGFASIAGPVLLAGMAPTEALLPVAIAILVGALFGIASETLANAMTRKTAITSEQAAIDAA